MGLGRVLSVCLLLAATAASADPQSAALVRDRALGDETAWTILESLTTEIGPRPAGSPAAARARDWAVAKFTELGFRNIRVEAFPKSAWLRDGESAEVIAPFPHKLAMIGLGNAVPTPAEGITAELAVVGSLADLKAAPLGAFAGKIVLLNQPMTRTQDWRGYAAAVAGRQAMPEAAKRGAVLFLVRSIATGTGRAPHTGGIRPAKDGIPAAALGVPDADMLARMAARGPVTLRVQLASHVVNTTAWNVSGEIPGSDAPQEIVVAGGHLDSWDPGTGAIDDGAGVAITMAAAHLIDALPRHPRRTIRIVLWGSEETSGSGAAYLAAHRNELSHIALVGESDLGADAVYSLQLSPGAWTVPDIVPLEAVLAPLKIIASREPVGEAGSDVSGLQDAGVPAFLLNQDARRYFDYHHSADDTLAIVDPQQLKQNVAAWAATLAVLADTTADLRKVKP